jgi:hypothetical protein
MENILKIVNVLFGGVIGIIAIIGAIWGGWSLFEGFTGDQPESKRRGFIVIVAAVVIIAMLLILKPILMSLINIDPAG